MAYAYKDIGGYRLSLRTYEGNIPGPTLRVRPGDTLRIRLVNELPPNPDPMPVDMILPHHFNTTNFHFHGSHVSPGGIADNIFRVDGARPELRHRDRDSRAIIRAAPIGTIRTITAAPTSRSPAAWRAR